jgi:hypothetical protein
VVNTFACYWVLIPKLADAFGRAGSNPVLDVFFLILFSLSLLCINQSFWLTTRVLLLPILLALFFFVHNHELQSSINNTGCVISIMDNDRFLRGRFFIIFIFIYSSLLSLCNLRL